METNFVEKYSKLSDMKAGDVATSKDRELFYVCGYHYDKLKKANVPVVLEMNNLDDQYTDKRDMSKQVRILRPGDKFMCAR